jgi:hypothetical protein
VDPFTILLIATAAVSATGSLIKGFGGAQASEAQAAQAARNAELLGKQAEIEKIGADVAAARGVFAQWRLGEQVGRVLASQPGYYAAAGVSGSAPTAMMLAAYSAMQGEADRQIIVANTAHEIAAARTRAANIYAQAAGQAFSGQALMQQAGGQRVAGVIGAGTAFLQAATYGAKAGMVPSGSTAGSPLSLSAPVNTGVPTWSSAGYGGYEVG